ncbi:major facilitator superfamily domain-containing protein [Aspergillus avenaceus]|uniref:Major facilitator superfamily domain-containing protein n=1 Tax=Aspergillus avenaceus TaxID=36643 RepID=A0A5N6U6A7_ASPAV|nr:major facilitator superfamily domain-containing protein [Aspergillus avenaceus]
MADRTNNNEESRPISGRSEPEQAPDSVTTGDGGYGWVVVFSCFIQTFWVNAWTGSWGIIQAALLLQSGMHNVPASTLSFVGSLGLSLTVALGLACVWLSGVIGARWSALIGILLFGASTIVGSFTVSNIAGLFMSAALYGLGGSLMFTMSNNLPLQWFSDRLGTANGLVKLGGGVGATVMAIAVQQLIDKVGIAWTFRIIAFASLASGIPTALLIREKAPPSSSSINVSLFRNPSFLFLFIAGFIGIFALYIPSFFLPTVATSIGLSSTTASGVMACYNACMAIGRLASGIACDKLGSTNMLLLTMALNAVTMLAIWSTASTLAVLMLFAALNGIANGAFFVTMPTAIGRLLGPNAAPAGIGMAITGWSVGDLLGNPIAGFLIAATHADRATSIVPYRSAIFYAGGTAAISTALVLVARLRMDTKLIKKI